MTGEAELAPPWSDDAPHGLHGVAHSFSVCRWLELT